MHDMSTWQDIENYGSKCFLSPDTVNCLKKVFEKYGNSDWLNQFVVNAAENQLDMEVLKKHLQQPELDEVFLLAVLMLYPYSVRNYKRMNWDLSMLNEALGDIGIWVEHHVKNFGFVGLQERIFHWEHGISNLSVIQLGRLQCNTESYFEGDCFIYPDAENPGKYLVCERAIPGMIPALAPHDPVINLHIPEGKNFNVESCLDSIERIKKFFAEKKPDYHYKALVCYSWLLDGQFQKLLPPESNIIKFQKLGTLFEFSKEPSETVWRVFGEAGVKNGVDNVEHVSSMQKSFAEFIRQGGIFKTGGLAIL